MQRRGGNFRLNLTDEALDALFWDQVDKSGECWLWTGFVWDGGYGGVTRRGKSRRAHVVSYEMAFGPVPNGLIVCHTCDVKLCVRPSHLYAGTNQDNSNDAVARDRVAWGERSSKAKLTEGDVRLLRRRYILGHESLVDLAQQFGVSITTVHRAATGRTWKRVKGACYE